MQINEADNIGRLSAAIASRSMTRQVYGRPVWQWAFVAFLLVELGLECVRRPRASLAPSMDPPISFCGSSLH